MKNIGPNNLSDIQRVKFEIHIKNAEFSKNVHLAEQEKSKQDSTFVCTYLLISKKF